MKHQALILLLMSLCLTLAGCSRNEQLSQDAADLALAQWANDMKFSIDAIEVLGIVSLPEQSAARVDLSFDDLWGFDDEPGFSPAFEGPALASFTRYDDGRWVLNSIAMRDRTWDNLGFEAVADSARLQALKDANLAIVAENQGDLIARREAGAFQAKSRELMFSIDPIKRAVAEFAIVNGRMPTADEVQAEALQSALISSSTWDGTSIVVLVNTQELGVTDSDVSFSVTPAMTSAGGVSFECVATAGAQYLTGCN